MAIITLLLAGLISAELHWYYASTKAPPPSVAPMYDAPPPSVAPMYDAPPPSVAPMYDALAYETGAPAHRGVKMPKIQLNRFYAEWQILYH